ncbi:hypothetical protein TNCV_1390101 [Trichonephila clavipes]|nr:hypothetical protein TNCV_1390101 [Trichonephila clavipes]
MYCVRDRLAVEPGHVNFVYLNAVPVISINKGGFLRNQSTSAHKSTDGKKEDFRVVKIEAELILKPIRLQLMGNKDLEESGECLLEQFHFERVETLPGAIPAAHGDPNMARIITKRKVTKVNSNLGYNLNLPDYYDDEDDSDRAKDSLTSRLVFKDKYGNALNI